MNLAQQGKQSVNVGGAERWASLIGGTALLLYGLQRRSFGGLGLALLGGGIAYRGATGHCQLYATLGVNTAEGVPPYKKAVKVEKTITVDAPPDVLYRVWRNFENLPRFMRHLESVRVHDQRRSHWVAKGPAGTRIEWDAEIINEVENELLAWQSVENADVYNSGSVHFRQAPGDRGTEMRVVVRYTPPAGALGRAFAKLFGEEPEQQLEEDLRRFKQIAETGEISAGAGHPTGRGELGQERNALLSLATLR